MPGLIFLKPGLQTLLVGAPRRGLAHFAVPRGGPMDPASAAVGRLLLRLPTDDDDAHPVLEVTALAPTMRFEQQTRLVLSGADFGWTMNGERVSLNTILEVPAKGVLRGGFSPNGLRGYVCIEGNLRRRNRPFHYAPFGANERLAWDALSPNAAFPLRPGPEFDRLDAASRRTLVAASFVLSTDSNRTGARLTGPLLRAVPPHLNDSVPVLPGFVQLPPHGMPLVVLQDGQTTGGYPRIAYLPERELGRFNQVPLRGTVQFRWAEPSTESRRSFRV